MWKLKTKGIYVINTYCATHAVFVYEKVDTIFSIWFIEGEKKMKGGDLTI